MRALAAAFVLLALPASVARSGAGEVPAPIDTTNTEVAAIAVAGDRVFVGGGFDRVGPSTGTALALSASTGRLRPFPRLSGGTASAIVPDGRGGWFLGGAFAHVGNVHCPGFAHVRASGALDRAACLSPNGPVSNLVVAGSRIYAYGLFSRLGGAPRSRLAAVDRRTGRLLPWRPRFRVNGPIVALAARGNMLYVGGEFRTQGGVPRAGAAAIDARGRLARWNPRLDFAPGCTVSSEDSERCDPVVGALAVAGRTVYLVGAFERSGRAKRMGRAAVDARTGRARRWRADMEELPTRFEAREYFGLAVAGSRVYEAPTLSAFHGSTGKRIRWRPRVPKDADLSRTLVETPRGIVLAYVPDGGESEQAIVAELGARTGRVRWQRRDLCCGPVVALARSGTVVVASGWFAMSSPQSRARVAALDARTGRFLRWAPRVRGSIETLAVAGNTLYAGGAFSSVNGQPRRNLAAFDVRTGALLPWAPSADRTVHAMAATEHAVYVGGEFERLGGQPRHDLGAFDAQSGALLQWNPDPDTQTTRGISAIEVAGGSVYVGGLFRRIGGASRRSLAALDQDTGLATPWVPALAEDVGGVNSVCAIAIGPAAVYAGGTFNAAGGDPARRELAAFDRATGAPTSFEPKANLSMTGSLCDDDWIALELRGSTLFVAHEAYDGRLGGERTRFLAALDAATGRRVPWAPLRSPGSDQWAKVRLLASDGRRLYLGGELAIDGSTGLTAFPL